MADVKLDNHNGFPVANPTVSYWQLPPHVIADHRTTPELPAEGVFDHIIIGSGISGAAVAFKLLSREPSSSVLMLEARTAASGASGRNGGHCRAGFWLYFRDHVAKYGEAEALKFERLEEQNVQDIADFVREHRIDCDFRDVETADVYVTEAAWHETLATVRAREEVRKRRPEAGPLTPRKVYSGIEAQERMGMPSIVGAVTWPAHTQNPYLLVCEMLQMSIARGLNLQTNTLATSIVPSSSSDTPARWDVVTSRGTVRAKNVVLATNAYTNALCPDLASTKFLTPARSQCAAIRPGSNATGNPALRGSAGLDDFGGSGDYFMCRAPGLRGEGDILYGGGRAMSKSREQNITDDSQVHPEIAEYLHRAPSVLFGKQKWGVDGDVVRDWTGITGYTPDALPLVGELPGKNGLWMSVGMNGHGMAMAFRCAEALVEMMTQGKEPDWFPAPLRLARAWERGNRPFGDLPIDKR